MKMLADLLGFCHDLDQFIGEILGMGSHEADPLQSVDLLDLFQKRLQSSWDFLRVFP